MLPHVMAQGTHQAPNKDLQALCAAWEASGRALAASLFVGFPHADVAMAGLSAVVVTDNDPADAQAMVDELLSAAWKARRDVHVRHRAAGSIGAPRQGDGRRAGPVAGGAAGSLRQLRQRRHDGHHRYAA